VEVLAVVVDDEVFEPAPELAAAGALVSGAEPADVDDGSELEPLPLEVEPPEADSLARLSVR
jgi:hypothetical protein